MSIGDGLSHAVAIALARTPQGLSQLVVLKGVGLGGQRTAEAADKLMFEARLTARMRHPNVVALHGLCLDGSMPVLALEYLEGQTLAKLLERANALPEFSLALRVGIACRILAGLEQVHELEGFDGRPLPIIHNALCPENVVITYEGVVKLIDFSDAVTFTPPLERRFTGKNFPYMAPEQVQGSVDRRVDVFSAGVLLWEMLAQVPLWAQVPEAVVFRRLLTGAVPRLKDVQPHCDPELDGICAKAMAPHPGDRFESAGEMRAALVRYMASRSLLVSDASIGAILVNAFRHERAEARRAIHARLVELGVSRRDGESPLGAGGGKLRRWLKRRSVPNYALSCVCALFAGAVVTRGVGSTFPEVDHDRLDRPRGVHLELEPERGPGARQKQTARSPERDDLVALDITVDPPETILFVDGQQLSSNPMVAFMVRDSRVHTLRGEAAGFQPLVKTFRLDLDLVIDAALRPQSSDSTQRAPREGADPWEGRAAYVTPFAALPEVVP